MNKYASVSDAEGIRAQLEAAGLSQRSGARALDIDERTMRRYCAGDLPVPTAVTMALRLLTLAHRNDRVIELIDARGAKLVYKRVDGGSSDITGSEKQRLKSLNEKYRENALQTGRKIVRDPAGK